MISGTRKFGSNWILIQKIFESKICVAWKKIRFKKNWELFWIESLKSKLYTLNMIMANYISSWKTSSICSTSTWHVSVIGIFYQYMWCYNRSFIRIIMIFSTSMRRSSWLAFGRSTGNDVRGHYKWHSSGTSVLHSSGRHSGGRMLAMT